MSQGASVKTLLGEIEEKLTCLLYCKSEYDIIWTNNDDWS
jgi:hypothetical protein